MLRIKRAYDDPAPEDGYRVLVDRLWPRGLTKERAAVDVWLKEVAPSTELRRRFHGQDIGFEEFERDYRTELATNPALDDLRAIVVAHDVVTLLVGARGEPNHATILRDVVG